MEGFHNTLNSSNIHHTKAKNNFLFHERNLPSEKVFFQVLPFFVFLLPVFSIPYFMDIDQKNIQALADLMHDSAVIGLLKEHKTREMVITSLTEQGVSLKTATLIVEQVEIDLQKEKKQRKAKRNKFVGAIYCMGGILGLVLNISFVFWFVIAYGVIRFTMGVAGSKPADELLG
jgi:hypothetical protein